MKLPRISEINMFAPKYIFISIFQYIIILCNVQKYMLWLGKNIMMVFIHHKMITLLYTQCIYTVTVYALVRENKNYWFSYMTDWMYCTVL